MQYDFSHLLFDHVNKVEKKIESLQKSFTKDLKRVLAIIAHDLEPEKRDELIHSINAFFDEAKLKVSVATSSATNHVHESLVTYLT